MHYLILIPIAVFVLFFGAVIVAGTLDYLQHRKDSKDLFKLLAKDHDKPKRRPAK